MALKSGVKAPVFSPTQKGPCENLNVTVPNNYVDKSRARS